MHIIFAIRVRKMTCTVTKIIPRANGPNISPDCLFLRQRTKWKVKGLFFGREHLFKETLHFSTITKTLNLWMDSKIAYWTGAWAALLSVTALVQCWLSWCWMVVHRWLYCCSVLLCWLRGSSTICSGLKVSLCSRVCFHKQIYLHMHI